VSDTVEVHGGTPLLDPNTSALGTASMRAGERSALNGRNPLGLVNTIPTVRGIAISARSSQLGAWAK